MKLQLGRRYRTRDGRETSPLEKNSHPYYPFKAELGGVPYTWTKYGLSYELEHNSPHDLVEEIVEDKAKGSKIDYYKMSEELGDPCQFSLGPWVHFDKEHYHYSEKEDGTIVLTPKTRKVWVEESEGVKKPDAVKPEHYRANGSDVITFCQDNNLDFLQGNVVKYITRYKKKNGKEDLQKAKEYIDRMISYEK